MIPGIVKTIPGLLFLIIPAAVKSELSAASYTTSKVTANQILSCDQEFDENDKQVQGA